MAIAIDFDGVIHRYSRGWADGEIYDPPMDGAIDGLHELMKDDALFVLTARPAVPTAEWLNRHGIKAIADDLSWKFWNKRDRVLITNRKLPARLYIDDRAIRFDNWPDTLRVLAELRRPVLADQDLQVTG